MATLASAPRRDKVGAMVSHPWPMRYRRLKIYLMGVVIGCVLLAFVPRPQKTERKEHPWANQTAPAGYYPRTLTDDLRRSVTLKEQPRNLVSLAPSITDMLAEMGMADHLVGVTNFCNRSEAGEAVRVGPLDTPSVERIVSLRPNLVIGTEFTKPEIYRQLEAAGIATYAFKHEGLDDVIEDLGQLAILLGVPQKGLQLVTDLRQRREQVADRVAKLSTQPKVALIYDMQSMGSAGHGSWVSDLIAEAGGQNVARNSKSSWPKLSLEGLLAANPEVILIAGEEMGPLPSLQQLQDDPVWGQIEAVQKGNVAILPPGAVTIPGPRMVNALEAMLEAIEKGAESN